MRKSTILFFSLLLVAQNSHAQDQGLFQAPDTQVQVQGLGGERPRRENVSKVPIGYIAEGALDTTANSDYTGPWRGKLTRPIYSIDGQNILFPVHSVVVGTVYRVEGPNEAINNRLGFAPSHIVRPDGEAFQITDQSVLDREGINGLYDTVDYHLYEQLIATGAYTAINVLPEILVDRLKESGNQNADNIQNFSGDLGERGQAILEKYIALVPTEVIRAKTPFRIFFTQELEVPVWRPTHRYQLSSGGN
ncbi:TrbI/VirB10 family protein [Kiloniella laminariae]|uniref:TrbI/VirB10 family protein n=1 Tax=Kiloniella laminariae TaxID=454162 RepID=A0ABT4LPM7_9PROT|nr:TrbI/VirB10 family protein [Kiloniella laminariae]MCZ4283084.1 TrbI/VirB10 family protein [Kiloniella laminariae]